MALSKFRSSSHVLEIERGRHTKPKTLLEKRTCSLCGILEDEYHFLIICDIYNSEREELFLKITQTGCHFVTLSNNDKFVFMLTVNSCQISTWVGKFIFDAMKKRRLHHNCPVN